MSRPRLGPGATRGGGGRGGPGRGGAGGGARGGRGGGSIAPGMIPASHITTIGVPRPGYGQSGRRLEIFVNSFKTTIPEGIIYHYDGACSQLGTET